MKIPETSAHVGAYYGNEGNGQWQPNGVIIDGGVGGGVVGSGDAGIHRPLVYPIPRGHVPGYVMAGAFYPPAPYAVAAGVPGSGPGPQDDFEDYMWMENEEEFDKQVMQQLEEEALMEQCIEAMLEDEQRERQRPVANGHKQYHSSGGAPLSLEETVSRSTLNPLAAEFVPTPRPARTEEKPSEASEVTPVAAPAPAPIKSAEETPAPDPSPPPADQTDSTDTKVEETPVPVTPEVSAADIAETDRRPKEKDVKKEKKVDKKPAKPEPKAKVPPRPAPKAEAKPPAKKKEVKPVKSEAKEEKCEEDTADVPKPQTTPTEEFPGGFKPINYAAAARANKPKKPTATPTPTSVPPTAAEKPAPKPEKKLAEKKEKPIQRKNSAK